MELRVSAWQPDQEAADCPICHRPFTVFFRRHHCRICGRVVCALCSPSSIPYPPGTYAVPPTQKAPAPAGTLLRTCDDCIREPSSSSPSSYSSFPASTSVARSSQSFPSLLYPPARIATSPTRRRSAFFSKGAIFPGNTSSPPGGDAMHHHHRRTNSASSTSSSSAAAAAKGKRRTKSALSGSLPTSLAAPAGALAPPPAVLAGPASGVLAGSTHGGHYLGGSDGQHINNNSSGSPSSGSSSHSDGHDSRRADGKDAGRAAASSAPPDLAGPSEGRRRFRFIGLKKEDLDRTSADRAGKFVASDDDDENSCPICAASLASLPTAKAREDHVNDCLSQAAFSGSPEQAKRRNRMVVYRQRDPVPGKECVICFEEFGPGDFVARLECLCVYHRKCIKAWFDKKGAGECPIHSVYT
ncbi:FYVE zinc finger-domain-containing protein [Dipodascopsis tothii]|uniref:FYVE zinc finger-domain-containing protein n=1 Tax=Dipodascopsis tothii TaxID=44089 RepID=UPI0034CDE605